MRAFLLVGAAAGLSIAILAVSVLLANHTTKPRDMSTVAELERETARQRAHLDEMNGKLGDLRKEREDIERRLTLVERYINKGIR